MHHPTISIITVCRNAGRFIERTIESVVSQTYPHIEYIVIDGASTDGTVEIIRRHEAGVSYWSSEPDQSHFDAMNKGLRHCTGDYVLFMNAGDRIRAPDMLERVMQDSGNADLIYAQAVYIDEAGNTRPWHKRTPPPEELNKKSFLNGMVICHHCMIVRRAIAPEFRLTPWKVSNDIEWAIRVMDGVKNVHFCDEVFCLYLEGGISNKQRRQALIERFDICRQHFGLWPTILEQIKIAIQAIRRKSIS